MECATRYHPGNFAALQDAYTEGLIKAVQAGVPFMWSSSKTPQEVAEKLLNTVEEKGIRTVSIKDSHGFKYAAKVLGLNNTYKAWESFLSL